MVVGASLSAQTRCSQPPIVRHAIIEPMPANDRMPCVWSRRSVLVALAVGSVAALSGCSVRLEDDAPRIPGLPTRKQMPDEQALLLARRDALRLKEIAEGLGSVSTPLTERLATMHQLQADVFESLLRSGGVPPAEFAGQGAVTSTPSAPAGAAPTTNTGGATSAPAPVPVPVPVGRLAVLVAAESERLATPALTDLAEISTEQVALFASMAAQGAVAARLLGGRPATARTLAGPTGDVAAGQLAAFRSAVYGFEVVAAQTDARRRKAAARTLGMLRVNASALEALAGSAATPVPLGYALPFPVTSPAAVLKLATHLMTALRESIASRLPAVAGDPAALTGTVHLLADVSIEAVSWEVPLTAFPGLSNT